MAAAEIQLRSLLQTEVNSGFVTACHIECGLLDQDSPTLQFFLSAERSASIFDLASLTKALATGPLIHRFRDRQQVGWHMPLNTWVQPSDALALPDKLMSLNLDELLGHCSGLPGWWNFWIGHLGRFREPTRAEALARMREVLSRVPLSADKTEQYSDVGYILLGYLLEILENADLSIQFQALRQSLLMPSSEILGFARDLKRPASEFVPTGFCKIRQRRLQGEVHDENCSALGGIAGHAGLFGKGEAVGRFLKCLYQNAEGYEYLMANEKTRRDSEREGLLGLRRGNGQSAVTFAEGKGMGHLGFTGTGFWIHWDSRKYAIFLSNRVISGRLAPRMTELRRQVFQLLDACLV